MPSRWDASAPRSIPRHASNTKRSGAGELPCAGSERESVEKKWWRDDRAHPALRARAGEARRLPRLAASRQLIDHKPPRTARTEILDDVLLTASTLPLKKYTRHALSG